MKARKILDLFIEGSITHEEISKIEVNNYTDLNWLIGAVDGLDVPSGEYVVYYKPITNIYDEVYCKPDYIVHDEDGDEIYLLKIEED